MAQFIATENLDYKIHIFGDSHTRLYSSKKLKHYNFNVYYILNINIKDFYQQNSTIEDLMEINDANFKEYIQNAKPQYKHMPIPSRDINKNDIIIFVMGEIDIRYNLESELNEGNDLNKILENWVNNYIECIKLNRERHPGVKFGLQSVLPTTDNKNYGSNIPVADLTTLDIEIRKEATLELNKLLKEKCLENDLLFIEITEYYKNDESDYPIPGLDSNSKFDELDTRIKDDGPHVNIEYPEGIELAFKNLNIPSNIITRETFVNYYQLNDLFIIVSLFLFLMFVIYLISNKNRLIK